ncbi:hypothetical protein R6Q57_011237 [Mikania cordata]
MTLAEISGDVASHFISGGNSGSCYDQIGSDKVKYCSENNKRLIHFSTCEVYRKKIGSFLPKDSPLRQWCSHSLSFLFSLTAEGAENGLEFTIVRPFNWIGPRMDFIPGIDGPSEGVSRVLACFSNNLFRREPHKLVESMSSSQFLKSKFMDINYKLKHPTYNELVDEVETLKETCNNATNAD